MRVFKAVSQKYYPTEDVLCLLERFRRMVNECIRIGLKENVTSLKNLSFKAYPQLSRYNTLSCFRLTAIGKAVGILRNYRKTLRKKPYAKKPHATKPMLTDCYSFKIKDKKLRLSLGHRQYFYIPLNKHVQAVISGYTVRSISLTTRNLSISFSKETAEIDVTGLIGIDRNLDNITTASSNGEIDIFDLSKATEIKAVYRIVKSHCKRNDVKVRKYVYSKYGRKQRNRVNQIIHNVTKKIVEQAKTNNFGIVMEKLKGIRKLYRKGNGQGRQYRSRMNSWSFYELQRQIEYKAKWEGIPIIYVSGWGTSKRCSICGCAMCTVPEENRVLRCPIHGSIDRDVNASINILNRGERFAPFGVTSEAMVSVKRRPVDVTQLSQSS